MKRKKLMSLFLAVVMVISTVTAMVIQTGATLLPIKSVNAKVTLSGYTDEELKEIPLGTILDKMEPKYSDEQIDLNPDDAVLVVDDDVYSEVDRDTPVDFYDAPESSYGKYLTLIIGSGKQLDPDNTRYYIDVDVTRKYSSNTEFFFYTMKDGEKNPVYTGLDDDGGHNIVNGNYYYLREYKSFVLVDPSETLYVEGEGQLIENATGSEVQADVEFTFSNNKENENGQTLGSYYYDYVDVNYTVEGQTVYTDRFYLKFSNARFIASLGKGKTAFADSSNPYNISFSVYLEKDEPLNTEYNVQLKDLYVGNRYWSSYDGYYYLDHYDINFVYTAVKAVEGSYTSLSDAEEKEDISEQLFGDGYKVNLRKTTYITVFTKYTNSEEEAPFPVHISIYGYKTSSSNSYRDDITVPIPSGNSDPWFRLTSASAEGYDIISRTLDRGNVTDTYYSFGYQTMFIYPKKNAVEEETTTTEEETTTTEEETTATEEETTVTEEKTTASEAEITTPKVETDVLEEETAAPEAKADVSEEITSVSETENETAKTIEETESAEAAEEKKDESALSELMLNVNTNGVNIYDSVSGDPVDFENDPQDFTAGTVQYTVAMEEDNNKTKNYFLSILQPVAGGAKLYVNGPKEREVYFDGYFDNRHDILIANIGDEVLTGLTAELIDAQNVKIDSYWNVGGEKNDTLQAFTSAYSDDMANLAKIRLVPDGEGEVKGTLKITADGQEPVLINLIGHAGDPKIVTESPLKDAVKYVPYRAIIANDNIHDWNEVTYNYYGRLPKGVTFNEKTGEIYGTPQETGTFSFHVSLSFSAGYGYFSNEYTDFELTVTDNTNDNVYNATDTNYDLKTPLGREATAGAHDYVLGRVAEDQLFVSNGGFSEFIDLWLNGQRLEKDKDYNVEDGSTRIVIFDETFDGLEDNENNTIAAEFREGGDLNNDLKRTAQNFKIDLSYMEPGKPGNPVTPPSNGDFTAPDDDSNHQGDGNQNNNNSNTSNGDISDNPEPPANTDNTGNNTDDTGTDSENQSQENQGTEDSRTPTDSVNIAANVTDTNGNAIAELIIELHSDVKTAITDAEGKFNISSAEFGSHTLILKNEAQGIYAEKKFEIIKSDAITVTDEIIYAPNSASISMNIVLDKNTIKFTNVNDTISNTGSVSSSNEDKAVPTGVAFPACVAVAALSAMGLIVLNVRRNR